MAKLFGAQRMVLQAVLDTTKDSASFVTDSQIAGATQIAQSDVRDWLDTLDGEGLVEVARTTGGLVASITAKGKLQLGLYKPVPSSPESSVESAPPEPPRLDLSPGAITGQVLAPTTGSPSPTLPPQPVPITVAPAIPSPASDSVDGFQVVLLIHGIRTQADWGPMVASKLEVPGQVGVIPIKYGYFDAFRFWFPFWTRNQPIERVNKQIRVALQRSRRNHPDAKLSIIAHSFGTYVVGEILKREFDLKIHRLILCGSVLPQDFPWEQYQGRFDDDKVINECGKSDIWPVLAQSASWGYGASGTHGFGAVLVKDRFHAGGHGQYFEPEFVEKYWEPFIRRGVYNGTVFETKMPPTPWWVSVLGMAPLKWLLVLLVASMFAFTTRWAFQIADGRAEKPLIVYSLPYNGKEMKIVPRAERLSDQEGFYALWIEVSPQEAEQKIELVRYECSEFKRNKQDDDRKSRISRDKSNGFRVVYPGGILVEPYSITIRLTNGKEEKIRAIDMHNIRNWKFD